jgi:hypothetical protein
LRWGRGATVGGFALNVRILFAFSFVLEVEGGTPPAPPDEAMEKVR